ncbi:dynein light chain binding protein [Aureococcus anophagefferens]|nr:dynein light chain binding protein [Aureococcus anophagefferens]
MAADFVKKLVLLNLGATEDEWADAVAIDEEAVALDAYSKTGGVALQSFFSDETPSGSAVFFYFETHADKSKPAERKLRCHSYTIPRAAPTARSQGRRAPVRANIDIGTPRPRPEDYDVVNQLEVAMESWSKLVATVVEAENSKRPKTKALAEIEFWRQRNARPALYEQINMPNVQDILKVLKMADAQMVATFN